MSLHYEKREYPKQRIKQREGKDHDIIVTRTSYIPVSNEPKIIRQYEPYVGESEKRYLNRCIDNKWITGGKNVKEFARRIGELQSVKYVEPCCNGTMALFMCLKAIGLKQGDEVIVPDFTFIASANSVVLAGGKPVFCDVDSKTFNMTAETINKVINDKTKVIMPVHIFGQSCDMDDVMGMANDYRVAVVEDAAQGIGVTWNGKPVGGFGLVNAMSFYGDKSITCLPAKTRILTVLHRPRRGGSRTRYIKDIKVGDSIVTYNESSGEKELDIVEQVHNRKVDKLTRLYLSNGNELDITENHPVYVMDKGWVNVEDLRIGDSVVQYIYYGLNMRIRNLKDKGKTLAERWGKDNYKKWSTDHKNRLRVMHRMSNNYNSEGYKRRGKNISISLKKYFKTPKGIQQANKPRNKCILMPLERLNLSMKSKQYFSNPDNVRKHSEISKNRWVNPEYRDRVIKASNEARKTPEYLKAYALGLLKKPNRAEVKLNAIIKEVCPLEFGYNGDYRLGISIGYYIPDFVNINGKKKVIELFGEHWHTLDEVDIRTHKMKELGWDCLIIWEAELKNIDKVANKIKTFVYNPNVELVTIVKKEIIEQECTVYNITTTNNHNYFAYGILVHNCGEGGAVLTNDEAISKKLIAMNNQGRQGRGIYFHEQIGWNFRMSDLHAGVGLAQLDKLDHIIHRKHMMRHLYHALLRNIKQVKFPSIDEHCFDVPFRITILVDNPEDLKTYLWDKCQIQTVRWFYPLHLQPCYNTGGDYPNSVWAYEHGLTLPSYVALKDEQIEFTCDKIKEFYHII